MRNLIDQLEQSLASRHYYLSLFAALAIPDIAGALSSPDGLASGEKYKTWFEQWIRPIFAELTKAEMPPHAQGHLLNLQNPLTGDACYRFRCSLLHQGSSQHPQSPFARIIFVEPDTTRIVLHYCISGDTLMIDLPRFCKEMIVGARQWLASVECAEPFQSNYERFARRRPSGFPPHVVGVPVVG